MTLNEIQTKQAEKLIEKYKFCSLETQKELENAEFFDKTEVQHLIIDTGFDKNIVVGSSAAVGADTD